MTIRRWRIGEFLGLAVYGDPERNPLLVVQRGRRGWVVMTRHRQWLSGGLREHLLTRATDDRLGRLPNDPASGGGV